MGVTIENRNHSIDMGYGGFFNLRKNIAGCYSPEFKTLYSEWCTHHMTDEEGNRQLSELYQNGTLSDDDDLVIEFLFASDCNGRASYKCCRRLFEKIKNYDDDVLYGYAAWPDCARFGDFKTLVHECAEHRWVLKWS